MALGPGKYDDVCSKLRELVGLTDMSPGGVVIFVVGGNKGSGLLVSDRLRHAVAIARHAGECRPANPRERAVLAEQEMSLG